MCWLVKHSAAGAFVGSFFVLMCFKLILMTWGIFVIFDIFYLFDICFMYFVKNYSFGLFWGSGSVKNSSGMYFSSDLIWLNHRNIAKHIDGFCKNTDDFCKNINDFWKILMISWKITMISGSHGKPRKATGSHGKPRNLRARSIYSL